MSVLIVFFNVGHGYSGKDLVQIPYKTWVLKRTIDWINGYPGYHLRRLTRSTQSAGGPRVLVPAWGDVETRSGSGPRVSTQKMLQTLSLGVTNKIQFREFAIQKHFRPNYRARGVLEYSTILLSLLNFLHIYQPQGSSPAICLKG